jgi:hypothetical protein
MYSAHVHLLHSVVEIANLTRGNAAEYEMVTDDPSTDELLNTVESTITKLRYGTLAIPGLSWELANVLRFVRATLVREAAPLSRLDEAQTHLTFVARSMAASGYSSELLVALLAAGHATSDALEARDVLTRPSA